MSLVETRYEHIALNESDVPVVAGTRMKVIQIVLETQEYGWGPEEISDNHPGLTLGQVYSALAYYWDHKEELDRDIERRLDEVDRLQRDAQPRGLEERLKVIAKAGETQDMESVRNC